MRIRILATAGTSSGRHRRQVPAPAVDQVLPIESMGEVIRGTLAGSTFPISASPFLMLAACCAGPVVALPMLEPARAALAEELA